MRKYNACHGLSRRRSNAHGIAPIKVEKRYDVRHTDDNADKRCRFKSQQRCPCKTDHTDDCRVDDLANKESIEHLVCVMDFFLDDLCPFVREYTIQEKFRLCAKQFAAGKEIYCNQKSEEHILEYTQDFNQLYGKIPYNP